MELTQDDRNYLARKLHWDCLGRGPSAEEQRQRAEQIRTQGLDLTYAAMVDSTEAKRFRARRGW
jgi:hypothetical protein